MAIDLVRQPDIQKEAGHPDRQDEGTDPVPADNSSSSSQGAHKKRTSKPKRLLRLILSTFDPRAWVHMLKVVNYYNYTHVTPMRTLRGRIGPRPEIAPNASIANPENITAGKVLHLGSGTFLWAGPSEKGRVVIGDDVTFGPRVMLTAANYRFNDGQPVRSNAMDEKEIFIGDDAWIGAYAIILPGARIGKGAVVGAGSVVTGDIPDWAIAVGAPAKVVGQRRIAAVRPPA
ncbi:hypothetical protein CN97_08400 [Haematobacter massiliensis]|uniref:Acyltransferase n=1 Tax=Haematobacter massiliensis TaxID=195105 RepID=A0A086XTI1_9RHOB|nr:hypothetical protein CN97_08400 [Haematobacter massiliensis]